MHPDGTLVKNDSYKQKSNFSFVNIEIEHKGWVVIETGKFR